MNLPAMLKGNPLAKGARPEFILMEIDRAFLNEWEPRAFALTSREHRPDAECIVHFSAESRIASESYIPRSRATVARWRDEAGALPSPARLQAIQEQAKAALAIHTEKGLREAVATLVGSYPSARPADPETYVNAMLYELAIGDYGDAVVALACQQVRRSIKFLPSIAEVIAAAEKIAARWAGLPSLVADIEERRQDYHLAITRGEAEIARIERLKAQGAAT